MKYAVAYSTSLAILLRSGRRRGFPSEGGPGASRRSLAVRLTWGNNFIGGQHAAKDPARPAVPLVALAALNHRPHRPAATPGESRSRRRRSTRLGDSITRGLMTHRAPAVERRRNCAGHCPSLGAPDRHQRPVSTAYYTRLKALNPSVLLAPAGENVDDRDANDARDRGRKLGGIWRGKGEKNAVKAPNTPEPGNDLDGPPDTVVPPRPEAEHERQLPSFPRQLTKTRPWNAQQPALPNARQIRRPSSAGPNIFNLWGACCNTNTTAQIHVGTGENLASPMLAQTPTSRNGTPDKETSRAKVQLAKRKNSKRPWLSEVWWVNSIHCPVRPKAPPSAIKFESKTLATIDYFHTRTPTDRPRRAGKRLACTVPNFRPT